MPNKPPQAAVRELSRRAARSYGSPRKHPRYSWASHGPILSPGAPRVDLARLNNRYDRLWRKAERLVETFLDKQLKAVRAKADPAAAAPLREVHVAVQCLKRIYEGRLAALTGGGNGLQSVGSNGATDVVAQELSRRIQALCERGGPDADDDDSM